MRGVLNMSNLLIGALCLIMREKTSGRKCPECGARSSLKIHKVNTDDFESYAKETEMVMRCKECGAIVHDPLEHPKSYAADFAQMYGIRYAKSVEEIAKKISL